MKKYLFFLLFGIFQLNYGQTYQPFPDSLTTWTVTFVETDSYDEGPGGSKTGEFVLTGDTLRIDSTVYNIVTSNHGEFGVFTIPDTIFIRKENKKIYYFDRSLPEEKILYDFNLSVDDHFPIYVPSDSITVDVTLYKIDSINIGGVHHKRFYYVNQSPDDYYFGLQFIEGVGSVSGLLYPYIHDRYSSVGKNVFSVLSCFENQDSLYKYDYSYNFFTSVDSCTNLISIEEKNSKPSYTYWYNHDNLHIDFSQSDSKSFQIDLYDMLGRLIDSKQSSAKQIDISTQNLSKGVYIVRIKEKDGFSKIMFLKE
jgi:hypothetical protein